MGVHREHSGLNIGQRTFEFLRDLGGRHGIVIMFAEHLRDWRTHCIGPNHPFSRRRVRMLPDVDGESFRGGVGPRRLVGLDEEGGVNLGAREVVDELLAVNG